MSKIDDLLILELQNGKYYTVEELAGKYHVKNAVVHQSFMRLNQLHGWSIRPENGRPYMRQRWEGAFQKPPFDNFRYHDSHRKKGETYNHDSAEPDWSRTSFFVRRPQ